MNGSAFLDMTLFINERASVSLMRASGALLCDRSDGVFVYASFGAQEEMLLGAAREIGCP